MVGVQSTATLASPVPHFLLTQTHLLHWPYLQTLPLLESATLCNSVSATFVNPCLSAPISSAPLNKSTLHTTTNSWHCVSPSITSDMVEGRTFVILTDHTPLTMLSSNVELNDRHGSYVTWSLSDNSLFRHILGQDSVVADALSRANSVMTSLDYNAVASCQDQDAKLQDILKMAWRFGHNGCQFLGRTSTFTMTHPLHNRGHS